MVAAGVMTRPADSQGEDCVRVGRASVFFIIFVYYVSGKVKNMLSVLCKYNKNILV